MNLSNQIELLPRSNLFPIPFRSLHFLRAPFLAHPPLHFKRAFSRYPSRGKQPTKFSRKRRHNDTTSCLTFSSILETPLSTCVKDKKSNLPPKRTQLSDLQKYRARTLSSKTRHKQWLANFNIKRHVGTKERNELYRHSLHSSRRNDTQYATGTWSFTGKVN